KAEAARHELQVPPPARPLVNGPGRAPGAPTADAAGIEPLAARIGGELRSPLNALLGFVQLMRNSANGAQAPGADVPAAFQHQIVMAL
ncbi:hypothetical protein NL317_29265, partial [Klebsiella pneumoniae]|nr:hypothetical protein [Klebsiella pneumoniae]